MTSVLITGASGSLGTMLRERLGEFGWTLHGFDRSPLPDADPLPMTIGDVTDPVALDTAFGSGIDAVVHLAGQPTETVWQTIRDINIDGTYQVFEAARRHGVQRVVYASSNHAAGFTRRPDDGELGATTEPRPDTLYGVSKAFGEALGRYYVDRYHFQVANLRIGSCHPQPYDHRGLATWLSPADFTRLVDACLRAPDLSYETVWGVSANGERWWSLDSAIDYRPEDDASRQRVDVPGALPSDDLVGGEFTTSAFGIDEVRANDRDR